MLCCKHQGDASAASNSHLRRHLESPDFPVVCAGRPPITERMHHRASDHVAYVIETVHVETFAWLSKQHQCRPQNLQPPARRQAAVIVVACAFCVPRAA